MFTLPANVPLLNAGLAVVLISCGVAIVIVLELAVAVTPFVPANVSVPPPDTLPDPLVPAKLIVVLTALLVILVIRPLVSTTIVGMLVAEP
jgi:hypothetical protein